MWKRVNWALFSALSVAAVIALMQLDLHANVPAAPEKGPLSVRAAKPDVRDIDVRLGYPAELREFQRSRIRSVGARGVVRAVHVDKGDKVKKGQKLVTIDCPDYKSRQRQAEEDVRNMSAQYHNANRIYGRLQPMRQQNFISQQELDNAEATHDITSNRMESAREKVNEARASLSFCHIRAPFSGEVAMRWLDPGAQLRPGPTEVLRLVNIDKLRVWVNVVEKDAARVKKGMPIELTVTGLPGRVFKGQVTRFIRGLDPRSRTLLTEVILPNPKHELKPGMFGRVALVAETRKSAVLVPESAVLTQQCGEYGDKACRWVYTVENNVAKRVAVEVGYQQGETVQIAKGLTGRELVIVQGRDIVGDGSLVKVVQ